MREENKRRKKKKIKRLIKQHYQHRTEFHTKKTGERKMRKGKKDAIEIWSSSFYTHIPFLLRRIQV